MKQSIPRDRHLWLAVSCTLSALYLVVHVLHYREFFSAVVTEVPVTVIATSGVGRRPVKILYRLELASGLEELATCRSADANLQIGSVVTLQQRSIFPATIAECESPEAPFIAYFLVFILVGIPIMVYCSFSNNTDLQR